MRLLLGAACAAAGIANAQTAYTWTDVTPNAGFASIDSIATHPLDPGRLILHGNFVVTSSLPPGPVTTPILYSDDRGATWSAPATPLPLTQEMFVHAGIPGVVYTTEIAHRSPVRDGHLYRSNDFGRSWFVVHTMRGDNAAFPGESMSVFGSDPLDPAGLYAMDSYQPPCGFPMPYCGARLQIGILRSADGGASWSMTGLPVLKQGFYGLQAAPTPGAPTTLFVSTWDGVLASRDRGATWSAFAPGLETPLQWARPDPVERDVLYGQRFFLRYDSHHLLVQSQDGGSSWRTIFDSVEWQPRLTIDPARSRILWVALPAGLYRSEDRGTTWRLLPYPQSSGVPANQNLVGLLTASAADPGVVYMLLGTRLFRGAPSARPNPVVVEFHYDIDRYWITSLDGEAVSQDYRKEPGNVWRTGLRWGAWNADDAPAGAVGSCRFWPKPQTGWRTRIIVLKDGECESIRSDPNWILEGEDEFFAVPSRDRATCPAGLVAVRRFHNLQPDFNHRWVADPSLFAEMRVQRAWYDEGVRFCARPLGANE